MKSKKPVNIEQQNNISLWMLVIVVFSVPLTLSTSLYNQSDLPKSAMLVFSGGLFITTVILTLIFKRSASIEDLYFNKDSDPVVFFILTATVLATVFSINPYISFWGQYQRQIGLYLIIYLVLIYFFASSVFKQRRNVGYILFAMEVTASIIAFYAVLQELGADPFEIQPGSEKRPVSTLGNSVFTGGFLAMVLPVSVFNASEKKNRVLRILFPLIILSGIIVSRTRSAYVALAVQIILFLIFYRRSGLLKSGKSIKKTVKFVVITGSVILIMVILIVLFPENKYSARILSIFGEGSNPRWLLWRDSFNVFLKYPLFGPGIGMFPNAFEEFYSYELRYADTKRYFDHPHNNFFQALYTMGAAGFIAYILFLYSELALCIKGFLNQAEDKNDRIIFFSLMLTFAGYCAYGLTNFDEISILLYLFIFAAVVKGLQKNSTSLGLRGQYRLPSVALGILLISLLGYNIYNTYRKVEADSHFFKGAKSFSELKFRDGAEEINKAIFANENCSMYRYLLALNVYKFITSGTRIDEAGKKNLLEQALAETEKAKKNFINANEPDALSSLILYELGRKDEAERLKEDVLGKNSINQDYRISLAYYFYNSGDTAEADEQVKTVLDIIPGSVNALNAAAFFSFKRGEMDKARFYCSRILEIEPGNRSAAELMKYIK